MERNLVGWFEIYVQDLDEAKKFYERVLKRELQKLDNPEVDDSELELWGFPGSPAFPGAAGALVKMKGFDGGGNSTLIYFSCHDCADEAGRVEENGGTIQREKFSIGQYGFIALVKDPEGNMFGLHSLK